jgi:hypothetical protein
MEKQPHNYDAESSRIIQAITQAVNYFMSIGAAKNQLFYLYGEDVEDLVPDRLKQQNPNAREITTYAQKVSEQPLYQYVAFSKTIEDGRPDIYKIIFLDNSEKSHSVVDFTSESNELVLTKTDDPDFVEYVRGDSLNVYSTFLSSEKLKAIEEKDSINLSTCHRLMLSMGADYGK